MTSEQYMHLHEMALRWLKSQDAGCRGCGDELDVWIDKNEPAPAVPVSDLQALVDGPDLQGGVWNAIRQLIAKHSPKPALPPNTHQQGTYLWAREEHLRGRAVRCPSRRLNVPIPAADDWDASMWTHDEFIATDWEVVP